MAKNMLQYSNLRVGKLIYNLYISKETVEAYSG